MAPIFHVVLTHASPTADAKMLHQLCEDVVALKEKCLKDNKPYIKSIMGGKDQSVEGMAGGITHAFVMEFETPADRDYYVHEDPVHGKMKEKMSTMLGKEFTGAQIVDFVPGTY